MERPQYEPAYPPPIPMFQKIDIAEHEPFYGLICSTGYRFERFERQRIFVVLRVSAYIEPFQRKDKYNNTWKRNRNHICSNRRFIPDHRPIADEVFLVCKQFKKLYCRNLERIKVRRKQDIPRHNSRPRIYSRHDIICYSEYLAEIKLDGIYQVAACLKRSAIRGRKYEDAEKDKTHRLDYRKYNIDCISSVHSTPPT